MQKAQTRRPRKPKERRRALRLLKHGRGIREVSRLLKIRQGTISRWCREAQLQPGERVDNAKLICARLARLTPEERAKVLAWLQERNGAA